jgi:TM2 domain-containing membrane protein YozV
MSAGAIILVLAAYFLPSIVGAARDYKGAGIFFVNLLLGWTGIGWLAAFIWACVGRTTAEDRRASHDSL